MLAHLNMGWFATNTDVVVTAWCMLLAALPSFATQVKLVCLSALSARAHTYSCLILFGWSCLPLLTTSQRCLPSKLKSI